MVLLESGLCGFWAAFLLFASCELSERLDSNALTELNDEMDQLKWYLLPIEAQKMLPLLFMYWREPLLIKFFGSIASSREQFKKVCQKSVSLIAIEKLPKPINK